MSSPLVERLDAAFVTISSAVADQQLTPESAQNLTRWLQEPYYSEYRDAILKLIDQSAFADLNGLFWERIPFGTGGRRGPMSEFGSATINARTIAESAHGLAVYVQKSAHPDQLKDEHQHRLKAVIARDTRHRSLEFARLTASVLAAHGFQVYFFPEARATPELSFAVRYLRCAAGVMISASHNPPTDNGFKAYWNHGGQVLPPHDAGIIECVDATEEIPQVDFDAAVSDGQIILLTDSEAAPPVDREYINAVCAIGLSKARSIRALYTPMHGVGESSIYKVLQQAGFHDVALYEPQRSQDGSFPNVPDHLPNPERPQALKPAIDFAQQHGFDVVLASDPDADRLAIAVRTANNEFVCLTGNQLGALITDYVLSRRQRAGTLSADQYVVETLVTTPMIETIATSYGIRTIRDLLVGFKHIAAAIDANGPDKFLFAAEESVGYLAGQYCRDKDACVAALYGLELASELKDEGTTLVSQLDQLYQRHGYFHETQFVQVCPGAQGSQDIARMMRALREKAPAKLGSIVFDKALDYQRKEIRSLPSNTFQAKLPQPTGDMLILEGLSGTCHVSLAGRPSGTEPKIKFYLFASCPADLPVSDAKAMAKKCLSDLESSLKQWLQSAVR